jgi:hypothetical protein
MNRQVLRVLVSVFLGFLVIQNCFASSITLNPKVHVPKQYQGKDGSQRLPNGQSVLDGYKTAYREFWLNCITVKSIDLSLRCPMTCSGTSPVTWVCADGSENALEQVEGLLKNFPKKQVASYLGAYSSNADFVKEFRNTRFQGEAEWEK